MKNTLFVFDLDGTLLDNNENMSNRVIEIIHDIYKNGANIIIASGRMYISTIKVIEHFLPFLLGKTKVISYNGSWVADEKGNLIFSKELSLETSIEIIKFLRIRNLHRQIYLNDLLISEEDNDYIKAYAKHSKVDYMVVNDLISYMKKQNKGSIKILTIAESKILDTIQLEAKKVFVNKANIVRSFSTFLDFIPMNVSKGKALKKILNDYKEKIEYIFVFGDNENDLSMFELTEYTFAMGNAPETVKKRAKYILPSVDEEGVVYGIEKIINNILLNSNS